MPSSYANRSIVALITDLSNLSTDLSTMYSTILWINSLGQKLGVGAYVRKPYITECLGIAVRKELDRST
jgi:hypothetical protein